MPLSGFSPRVRDWFVQAFAAPTPAQAQAWPAIAGGENVLVSAPTGSGKTLAAFLWALDRLSTPGPAPACRTAGTDDRKARHDDDAERAAGASRASGTRVVYVSPLKALAYDIERNLRAPLRGIGAEDVRVGIRTGDTPQRERAAMVRNPPDILVTTPESLYLILTSHAREMLSRVDAVIVDEIHAVAHSKRGSHLALTLERLEAHVRARREERGEAPTDIQRIGLSATQNPLEEIGRFLVGPNRQVTIIDAGARKQLDLRIEVPVESMAEPGGPSASSPGATAPGGGGPTASSPGATAPTPDPLEPLPGGEAIRGSIWPAIYPELLKLVREHISTIIFVNNRRSAERVALRLNELAAQQDAAEKDAAQQRGEGAGDREPTVPAPADIARAHHGSLAREERTKVEELLKAGQLPCLVATSSLELGIDMGAVDLVLQIESPKSVTRGLQRIGRAGHGVDQVSVGRIFPKFRGDLLECAVVARRMHEGLIEPTVVPRNALDVLAQQIVAIAVSAEPRAPQRVRAGARRGGGAAPDEAADVAPEDAGVLVEDLYALVTSTHSYSTLSRELLHNVLDMLDGRYPSKEFGELRARIVWDRVAGIIRARKGSRQLAIANAGTIPDRGLYAVTLPDGRRVGELDEEMVYEARPGQVFLLGASTWRIEEIGRDRVIVTPAPGAPGAVPFWKGDSVGRPIELGKAIGAFSRWAVEQDAEVLQRDYDLDERAARNLLAYLREQQSATRVLPSERTIVLERFRDEIGDWRLCILSPYGGRVHSAWGLALSARIRERYRLEADVIASDDGIVLHLPDMDEHDADALGGWESISELVLLEPDEVHAAVTAELGGSALFGARFRENASRALLIPRAYPGRRTPLWQQRLKAQNLLEVARRYDDFPIVLETYRECLKDVLDVPGLQELLRGLSTREISLVEVDTPTASPFASSLLFDYVATYMYEGDTPNAERRAAALSLDRDLLRELLGQEELRELIDPGALARVEDDLQRRSEIMRATGRDGLHDVLRHVGDLNGAEVAERVFAGVDAGVLLGELERERRVVRLRVGGEERWVAADEAGLYRDALGAMPPGGLPDAFLMDVPDALRELVARYARTHGPFTHHELFVRYCIDTSSVLRELERSGALVRGELRPGGTEREWCDVDVLRRLRRASLAALRKEIEPADQRRLAAFLPSWQGVDRHSGAGAGIDRLREVLVPLQGLALPVDIWERDVLPRRTGAYSQSWLDSLCASGELVWVGAGPIGRSGRVALYFREDAPAIGVPTGVPSSARAASEPPSGPQHDLLRARLATGPSFFTDLLAEIDAPAEALREALWDLVWAGEVTNDAWAPLRAPRLALARGGAEHRTSVQRAGARGAGPPIEDRPAARSRFSARRSAPRSRGGAHSQVQGRWSLTDAVFRGGPADGPAGAAERRRALAELLLERYGIVTREQVLAEGVKGGFAMLYDTFANLETLGVCRRGYFIEGMGGAQFALPGAVERLRAGRDESAGVRTLVIAAADPAQPYGAALAWPKREGSQARPARVAGAYVVLVADQPVLYVERGGRSLVTLADATAASATRDFDPLREALVALADAVRTGRLGKLALERIDGEPALGSSLAGALVELGFHSGPRKLTLTA
ncbi:MAG TPA: DEAD/DEAH box helicase [Solirubrobacteraceae bacterium]|jgi:ATP-dependent Lhr-like helicase|nr:DEAD/DEAH box helicase [Solirubrobacteraceae bacterium]